MPCGTEGARAARWADLRARRGSVGSMERAFLSDIEPFIRGGLPGLVRLKQVLGSILKHHRVPLHRQRGLLLAAGLHPQSSTDRQRVSFHIPVRESLRTGLDHE